MPGGPTAADEFGGGARLLTDAAGTVAHAVQRMHRAIARRSFAVAGRAALPVKAVHDGISELVYAQVRAGIGAGGALVEVASRAAGRFHPDGTLTDSTVGRAVTGVLNGAFGERAEIRGELLPEAMTLRVAGHRVTLDAPSLAEVYPEASGRLAVFLHGVIETERWWFHRPADREQPPGRDFGARLAEDFACSPLYLRYNSGRHISDNGRELMRVLSEITSAWPVPVTEIVLIGHSMGGLVARSAVHQAAEAELPWLPKVTKLVCLGTPHSGAPLERGANVLTSVLRRFDESAPLGELLAGRSSGIKDLRHGYLHEQQWAGRDPDILFEAAEPVETLLPAGTRLYFLSATLARREDSLLAQGIGDLLVMPKSAGDGTQQADRRWLGGLHHFHLLHRDEVYEVILDWLRT
jgi:pimeloyl-ACP methyl ester carboxylesterase